MKKAFILLTIFCILAVAAILSPWEYISEKALNFFNLSLYKNASVSINIKSGDAKVFIDDKEMGVTPYENNKLIAGQHAFKLVRFSDSDDFYKDFYKEFDIEEGTQLVINWDIGPSEEFSSGEIYFFRKRYDQSEASTVSIIYSPDEANVYFDDAAQEGAPIIINDVKNSNHKIKVTKEGYIESESEVQVISGYDLFAEIKLFPIPIDIYMDEN